MDPLLAHLILTGVIAGFMLLAVSLT